MDASAIIRSLGGPIAVSKALGVKPSTATYWGLRNSIPLKYWENLLALAGAKGVALDERTLIRHCALRSSEAA